jgi:hypothetical protein
VGERQPADDPAWLLAQRQPEGDRAPGLEILPFRSQVLLLLAQGEQAFRPGGKPGLVKEPVAAVVVQDIGRSLLADDTQQEARCPERMQVGDQPGHESGILMRGRRSAAACRVESGAFQPVVDLDVFACLWAISAGRGRPRRTRRYSASFGHTFRRRSRLVRHWSRSGGYRPRSGSG